MNEVPLAARVRDGVRYLARVRNPDGGVPATSPGDPSGCWTTAEALEAVLTAPWFGENHLKMVEELTEFLLDTRIEKDGRLHGWPLVVGGREVSTMATAGALTALSFWAPARTGTRASRLAIRKLLEQGVPALEALSSRSGGWGVEPFAGPAGAEPRVVSTHLALRALAILLPEPRENRAVQAGVEWLWRIQTNGGFPPLEGRAPDPCSTVRAHVALQTVGVLQERRDAERSMSDFVLSQLPGESLWPLDTETYVADGSPGQVIFNNNSTAEILVFLTSTSSHPQLQDRLARWFVAYQREEGSWCLGANDELKCEVLTWSTSEAVIALSSYIAQMPPLSRDVPPAEVVLLHAGGDQERNLQGRLARYRFITRALATLLLVETLILAGLPTYFETFWASLPGDFRSTFVLASIVAVALNLISSLIFWLIMRIGRTRRGHDDSGGGGST